MSWAALFFALGTIIPVPPEGPSITTVSPSIASPRGGQTISITGRNFQAPVRVLFEFGEGAMQEAFAVSMSTTQISVVTPPVSIVPPAQALEAAIVVVTSAGTTRESRVRFGTPFVFRNETLTPRLQLISPNTGSIVGGTRTAIFGEGFEQPVQVFFGSTEARVLNVSFTQIAVEIPPMREETVVDVHVRNIGSQTSGTLAAAFRYRPKSQIMQVSPTSGPENKATRVTIDGVGFQAPVAVIIGGVAAQPIQVTGTRIIALTVPLERTCRDSKGPVVVTSVVDGEEATAAAEFTFVGTQPAILSVAPARAIAGGRVEVTTSLDEVLGAQFSIGGFSVRSVSERYGPATTTFVLPVPNTFAFPAMTCDDGGTRSLPVRTTIVYTRRDTTCIATRSLIVVPDSPDRCATPRTPQP